MKLLIVGAGGNSGTRLTHAAIAAGHAVTAYVRNADRLAAALGGLPPGLQVATGDGTDAAALRAAMTGQDAVINAAGIVTDGAIYTTIVGTVIAAAAEALGAGGRFWLFGGLPVLDIAGTARTGLDLPGLPEMYAMHRTNYDTVRATALDWSMLCPGPMVDGPPHAGLRLSADVMPLPLANAAAMDIPALAGAIFGRMGEVTISYADAAAVILDHLARGGPFKARRVGVALPA
jgi:putative NADH-flavin reductase